MNQNPLLDLANEIKQNLLETRLQNIEKAIGDLGGGTMANGTIDFDVFQNKDGKDFTVKATIAIRWITYIEDNGEHCYVHMADGTILYAVPTREEVVALIGSTTTDKTYIV